MAAVIRTASGRTVPLLAPQASHIRFGDVAQHLARINRFAGATETPYSVAQHAVLVSQITAQLSPSPEVQLWGLLHDAHEAYLGDVTTPVKHALFGEDGRNVLPSQWDSLAAAFDAAIAARAGLVLTRAMLATVQQADEMALVAEWQCLMPGPCPVALPPGTRGLPSVTPWPWHRAEEQFLKTFNRLAAACGLSIGE